MAALLMASALQNPSIVGILKPSIPIGHTIVIGNAHREELSDFGWSAHGRNHLTESRHRGKPPVFFRNVQQMSGVPSPWISYRARRGQADFMRLYTVGVIPSLNPNNGFAALPGDHYQHTIVRKESAGQPASLIGVGQKAPWLSGFEINRDFRSHVERLSVTEERLVTPEPYSVHRFSL
jgi:hypothetical protein